MGYEVDVIGIGQGSKSGDAIAIRWGNLYGSRTEQKVVIIDGGFRESGRDVVNHVRQYFETDHIDAIISTHPDQDHVNGLQVVLDQLSVRQLWIHKPWEHNHGLSEKFSDGRVTDFSLGRRLRESLESASDLVAAAIRKGVHVVEPFAGVSLDNGDQLRVLGPRLDYYETLIPEFDGMPKAKETFVNLLHRFSSTVTKTMRSVVSRWGIDALNDSDTTSAKNNSSVISTLIVEGHCLLFTGDAGVTALSKSADLFDFYSRGFELRFMQIPHHGSRRNIGPTILNRLIGRPLPQGESRNITAIASTAKNGEPKHPRKAVLNAFTHRGVKTLATRGKTIWHNYNAPQRKGWSAVKPEKYYWTYEDEE